MTGRALPSGPRPKRGGEDFARAAHRHGPKGKKPRFDPRNPTALAGGGESDEDEEDAAYLEADELTRRGHGVRRNAVNIDGFESDSSNDAFDRRAAAKADAKTKAERASKKAAEDGDDDDMFAGGSDDDEVGKKDEANDTHERSGKPRKDVRFADLTKVDDLEEVAASKAGGHVSSDLHKKDTAGDEDEAASDIDDGEASDTSDESSAGDAQRAALDDDMDAELGAGAKKRHAPKLDAFNLAAERQEGAFDESLNYVRAATDPDARLDNWMSGVSRRDMRRAKEAQAGREKDERAARRVRDAVAPAELIAALVAQLRRGETPLEALRRLAPPASKARPAGRWAAAKKAKKKGAAMDVDAAAPEKSEADRKREAGVEAISEAAGALLEHGETEVYDTDREMLRRWYKRETGEDLVEPPGGDEEDGGDGGAEAARWEFRWVDAGDGGEIHGPYDVATMKAWRDAGYFGGNAQFRASRQEEWSSELTI